MALYASLDRRRLLDWLAGAPLVSALRKIDLSSLTATMAGIESALSPKAEMLLLWRDQKDANDRTVRPVIVVKDDVIDDFLAWTSTFIATYSPFTAFFRVVTVSDIERFELHGRREEWIESGHRAKLAGIALAEALVQTGFRAPGAKGLNIQTCELTFSFAVLKGINAGLHPAQLIDLAEAWDRVRSASSQRSLALSPERSLSFWLLATEALLPDENRSSDHDWMRALSGFIRDVQTSEGYADSREWPEMPVIRDVLNQFRESSSLPRERQIKVLDTAANELQRTELPVPLVEAILGYMISRLGDGSFDYLALSAEYKNTLEVSALWVAFFSMFRENFDGLSTNMSLGQHVAKRARVVVDIFDPVVADVGAREMLILVESRRSGLSNLTDQTIQVELLPCLTVPFPNPLKRSGSDSQRGEVADLSRLQALLREAIYLVERSATGRQAQGRVGKSVEPDLFRRPSATESGPRRRPK